MTTLVANDSRIVVENAMPFGTADDDNSASCSETCRSGLAALSVAAGVLGQNLSLTRLMQVYSSDKPLEAVHLAQIANSEGLKSALHTVSWERLPHFNKTVPFIARLSNGAYIAVVKVPEKLPNATEPADILIFNPRVPNANYFAVNKEKFVEHWTGEIILLKRRSSVTDPNQRFGPRWFIAAFWQQRSLLKNVAIAALLLHLLSLAVPIFFQIVIDRVLVFQNMSTLIVITIGVVAAIFFEATLTWLRGYFVLNAATRLDMHLARLSFRHLVGLPISFFKQARAGVITRHMQQASQIREFLTGRLLTTLLDLPAILVLLPLLIYYSPTLTLIVLLATAILGGSIALIIGPYRRYLRQLYAAEATKQSLLVENIHGMQTIKALNLEPNREQVWNDATASSLRRYTDVGNIALINNSFSQLIEKALAVTVVVAGCFLVFSNRMSVGALVAFNMLALRLIAPIIQVIGLLNNYQETLMSIDMLGEIMNRPVENKAGGLMPVVSGQIEFDRVTFLYPGTERPALQDVSLRIAAGKLIGIVGRSGSGKTTLSSMLQGLNIASGGAIRIDGYNIEDLDLAYLRRQIGVVPQEAFLFRGTIKENIHQGNRTATFEDIVRVARLAGADEFIQKLPRRYDTDLEENGVNLSGGQKQRLAIARALLRNPRILIFDEATSALDPDSEAVVMQSLRGIAVNRTTVVISHRLYTICNADSIIVMDDGRVLDIGSHTELLGRNSVYQGLWAQQTTDAFREY